MKAITHTALTMVLLCLGMSIAYAQRIMTNADQPLTLFGDELFFIVEDHPLYGKEIWKANADGNVTLMKDLREGTADGVMGNSVVELNGKLYFIGRNAQNFMSLYETNGLSSGTKEVKILYEDTEEIYYPNGFSVVGNKLFFDVDINEDLYLWATDGTAAGTVSLGKGMLYGSAVLSGTLYFPASSQLKKSDGTVAGTVTVKEMQCGSLELIGDQIFFNGNDPDHGLELWKTDGTEGGTVMIKDINPGTGGSSPGNFIAFNDKVYFRAFSSDLGDELWVTDGTTDGTVLVKDIISGSASGQPLDLFVHNSILFFTALLLDEENSSLGFEFYKTDGTTEGTVLLKEINPGIGHSFPYGHFTFNNIHFFNAYDGIKSGIWKTDGTANGTVLVFYLDEGASTQQATTTPVFLNGYFYFVEKERGELYRSDGTPEGTTINTEYSLITAVEEPFNPSDIKIYPNPVNDYLTVESELRNFTSMKLLTTQGSVLLSMDNKPMQKVDLTHLRSGVYLLRVTYGAYIKTYKVVKP